MLTQGLLLIGAVFKATVPDESDEERRELERMVAEAAAGKSKHGQLRAAQRERAKKHESTVPTPASPAPANGEKEKAQANEEKEKPAPATAASA